MIKIPTLGVRIDNPYQSFWNKTSEQTDRQNLMELVAHDTPFTSVRIAIEEALTDKSRDAILEAKKHNLDMVLMFNPKRLITETDLRTRLSSILGLTQGYPGKVYLEAGNEVDHLQDDSHSPQGSG